MFCFFFPPLFQKFISHTLTIRMFIHCSLLFEVLKSVCKLLCQFNTQTITIAMIVKVLLNDHYITSFSSVILLALVVSIVSNSSSLVGFGWLMIRTTLDPDLPDEEAGFTPRTTRVLPYDKKRNYFNLVLLFFNVFPERIFLNFFFTPLCSSACNDVNK